MMTTHLGCDHEAHFSIYYLGRSKRHCSPDKVATTSDSISGRVIHTAKTSAGLQNEMLIYSFEKPSGILLQGGSALVSVQRVGRLFLLCT